MRATAASEKTYNENKLCNQTFGEIPIVGQKVQKAEKKYEEVKTIAENQENILDQSKPYSSIIVESNYNDDMI